MAQSSSNGRTRTIQPLAETPRRVAILKKLRSRPTVMGSVIALVLLMVVVMAAPYFAPQNPYDLANLNLLDGRLPPGSESMDGQVYLLGTDDQGRDMFSRSEERRVGKECSSGGQVRQLDIERRPSSRVWTRVQ